MSKAESWSRRTFLGTLAAASSIKLVGAEQKHVPVGLELYSVREGLTKDLPGTLQAVAKMGYECVEFYSPYYDWKPDYAKEVRKHLDDVGLRCYSTHNAMEALSSSGVQKAIELNKIIGTKYIVLAHSGDISGVDGWKQVADTLNQANKAMKSSGLHAGYHNHDVEWKPVEGQRPIDILAKGTDKSIMLQLDVGTCLEAGNDPVSWIEKNPGRIRSLHLKDWSADKGYKVLFGEGEAKWKNILHAAQTVGGAEFYLIEQEGSAYPELETAERCLVAYKNLNA